MSPAPYHSLNMSTSTGDSIEHVRENRDRFLAALEVTPAAVSMSRLYHGNAVTVLRRGHPVPAGYDATGQVVHSDALVSNLPGRHFTMTFADCVPLLFADVRRGVVAAAHAGWRGTALGIAAMTVRAMREMFDSRAEDIVAAIGPSIGPCCFEVGDDVPATFERQGWPAVRVDAPGKPRLDLWATNRRQMLQSGVLPDHVEIAGICTSCSTQLFYSHRAESGNTGRFALCIGLR